MNRVEVVYIPTGHERIASLRKLLHPAGKGLTWDDMILKGGKGGQVAVDAIEDYLWVEPPDPVKCRLEIQFLPGPCLFFLSVCEIYFLGILIARYVFLMSMFFCRTQISESPSWEKLRCRSPSRPRYGGMSHFVMPNWMPLECRGLRMRCGIALLSCECMPLLPHR